MSGSPHTIAVATGSGAYANPGEALSDALFGARYISYNGIARFEAQVEDTNLGLIVWPGGTLAETRPDRYGFDFDGLQNPANNKPNLPEMMAIAVEKGAKLSVILPTVRYVGDPDSAASDVSAFMTDLLSGAYGPLPEELIFEIGSEYYAHLSDGVTSAAKQYAEVADAMITEIASALTTPASNPSGLDVTIAVQSGKTLADDIDIRAELGAFAIDNVDMLIHHRFAYQPQGIDPRIAEYQAVLDAWQAETGEEPELFVSAHNTVTVTRNGLLDDYIAWEATLGNSVDPSTVDLAGRTTTRFEDFWQDELDQIAYGQEHAAYILESFASYAELGADAASLYGIDLEHPGRVSWRESGTDHRFIGADMLDMLYESLDGTHVLTSDGDYDTQAPATTYGFENEDKLVIFVAAGEIAPGEVALSLTGLGSTYSQVWAERLTASIDPDWMTTFGVADNPAVDESPEAETYAYGLRTALTPALEGGEVTFTLGSPHEVVRLAFAKTADGAAEIAGWSDGRATDLSGEALPPVLPGCGPLKDGMICLDYSEGEDLDLNALADAVGSGGGFALLLAMLMLI